MIASALPRKSPDTLARNAVRNGALTSPARQPMSRAAVPRFSQPKSNKTIVQASRRQLGAANPIPRRGWDCQEAAAEPSAAPRLVAMKTQGRLAAWTGEPSWRIGNENARCYQTRAMR